ncbi:MAG: hypothetical protein AVDCRST_MAG53-2516, partial [uncultured Solirubrobacteraceae bacterium]
APAPVPTIDHQPRAPAPDLRPHRRRQPDVPRAPAGACRSRRPAQGGPRPARRLPSSLARRPQHHAAAGEPRPRLPRVRGAQAVPRRQPRRGSRQGDDQPPDPRPHSRSGCAGRRGRPGVQHRPVPAHGAGDARRDLPAGRADGGHPLAPGAARPPPVRRTGERADARRSVRAQGHHPGRGHAGPRGDAPRRKARERAGALVPGAV